LTPLHPSPPSAPLLSQGTGRGTPAATFPAWRPTY